MTDTAPDYIHGSSPEEQHRLSLLNDLLNAACLRELPLKPGQKVLDLGSGLGQFTRLMARTVGRSGQVVGVERDPDQIRQARALADDAGELALVEFRQGDACDLPLGAAEWGSFDLVHARFLLEHISQPEQVIAQMIKALRPGGRIFVSDDDHDQFRPWPEPRGFPDLWRAYVRSFQARGNDPFIGRRLAALLRDGGLTSISNTSVFFGGCAGNDRFLAVADNLIAALFGARDSMLSHGFLDEAAYQTGMDGLQEWKADPSAVLWYSICCAEGVAPG